jgi:hypothetical protein
MRYNVLPLREDYNMLIINTEMQTGYNGWSCWIEDEDEIEVESEMCNKIADALPDITYVAYDDDGDCVGDPTDFEGEVRAAVAKIVGDHEFTHTISYDNVSS